MKPEVLLSADRATPPRIWTSRVGTLLPRTAPKASPPNRRACDAAPPPRPPPPPDHPPPACTEPSASARRESSTALFLSDRPNATATRPLRVAHEPSAQIPTAGP